MKLKNFNSDKNHNFIEKAKEKHREEYDYSLVKFKTIKEKVKIIHKKCGHIFEQIAEIHLRGSGCSHCFKVKKKTTESFTKEAKEKHGEEYDYSLVNYTNTNTKIKIMHKKCGHIFEQTPANHLNGSGCHYCYKTKKKTTESFIEEAKEKHGEEYDYSLVNYTNINTKIKILHKKCGNLFEQNPSKHLNGSGCHYCFENKTKKIENFIEEAKEKHGEEYDYSLVDYKNNKIKIKIIHKKCGNVFEQTPSNHLNGNRCSHCYKSIAYKTEEYIKKAKEKHGEEYDYSLVNYKNNNTKIKIIHRKCGNVFEQTPSNHLNGNRCSHCYKSIAYKTEEYIKKAKEKHGEEYDYSLVNYTNINTKIKIICNKHNSSFFQYPLTHLKGAGCPVCNYNKKTEEEFIEKSKKIHKSKYDYSDLKFYNYSREVNIFCNTCNKVFSQKPLSHLKGHGCSNCSITGFKYGEKGKLYYISINNGEFYKIGITNRTVKERMENSDYKKIKIIKQWNFKIGKNAFKIEQYILKRFKKYLYKGNKKILENGNTEIFIKDVLSLDDIEHDIREMEVSCKEILK